MSTLHPIWPWHTSTHRAAHGQALGGTHCEAQQPLRRQLCQASGIWRRMISVGIHPGYPGNELGGTIICWKHPYTKPINLIHLPPLYLPGFQWKIKVLIGILVVMSQHPWMGGGGGGSKISSSRSRPKNDKTFGTTQDMRKQSGMASMS